MMRRWVVRVALTPDEVETHSRTPLIECLRHAGVLTVHNERVFDIEAPRHIIRAQDTKAWAEREALRMQSFNYNAVAAPQWRAGEVVES
jgi:hypothetical protein